jgi:RimJ/RimL family protein N-acetyltransferase
MAWYSDDYNEAAAQSWIASSLASAKTGTAVQFAILRDDEDLVGVLGFEDIGTEPGRAMLGYWLATDAVGQGIGRRAIALALGWARDHPGLRTVWAVVAEANLASQRVLEINQFRMVGSRGIDERGDLALLYELELHAAAA